MMSTLSFLMGILLFTIPMSHELPETRADNVDGLDENLEQLIAKVSAAERERGLMRDMAENPGKSIRENENRKETVQKIGDGEITRVDESDENGQITEQRYRDCAKRNELIVMKPGTQDEECLLHDMDNNQYSHDCQNKGKRVGQLYQITSKIKDKTFLKEALGIPLCQNVSLSMMEHMDPVDDRRREMTLQVSARGCTKYCCNSGWWGSCANECVSCHY